MGTYPWGPHGPQAGAHEVTPNPTPAYVPPPESPSSDWDVPAPSSGGGSDSGGGPAFSGGGGSPVPRPRSYFFAILSPLIFGPFALLIYSLRGMLIVLTLLLGYPVALIYMGQPPGVYEPGLPISIWGNDAVMQPLWWKAVALSLVWAVVVVARHNRKLKAAGKITA